MNFLELLGVATGGFLVVWLFHGVLPSLMKKAIEADEEYKKSIKNKEKDSTSMIIGILTIALIFTSYKWYTSGEKPQTPYRNNQNNEITLTKNQYKKLKEKFERRENAMQRKIAKLKKELEKEKSQYKTVGGFVATKKLTNLGYKRIARSNLNEKTDALDKCIKDISEIGFYNSSECQAIGVIKRYK